LVEILIKGAILSAADCGSKYELHPDAPVSSKSDENGRKRTVVLRLIAHTMYTKNQSMIISSLLHDMLPLTINGIVQNWNYFQYIIIIVNIYFIITECLLIITISHLVKSGKFESANENLADFTIESA